MNALKDRGSSCSKCGATLAPGVLGDSCPRCLLAGSLGAPTAASGAESGSPPGSAPPLTPSELAPLFPQFEIVECLGRGGMGVVYKARQPRLNRWVALKVLAPEKHSDAKFAERFAREAQVLARLNHPAIVAIHDFGESGGYFYLLMEYVDGVSLRETLRTRRLSPLEAMAIIPQICAALQYAHDQGVVHRDIKPENLLVDRQGRVKIADFGIAKILSADEPTPVLTQGPQRVGTPHYMAPEQVEAPARVDHRADLFSLGVVFYEMLTGELPLGRFEPPSHRAAVDTRLDPVVLRALDKEPARRFQQAAELEQAVTRVADSPPPRDPSPLAPPRLAGASAPTTSGGPPFLGEWLASLALHGTLLMLLLLLLRVVVPRFVASLAELGQALPLLTRWTLATVPPLASHGLILLPILLALDAGLGWAAHASGRRAWRRVWSAGVSVAIGLAPIPLLAAILLPFLPLVDRISSPKADTPVPLAPPSATAAEPTADLVSLPIPAAQATHLAVFCLDLENGRRLTPPMPLEFQEPTVVKWNDASIQWARANHVSLVVWFDRHPVAGSTAVLDVAHLAGLDLKLVGSLVPDPVLGLADITPATLAQWRDADSAADPAVEDTPWTASWARVAEVRFPQHAAFWTRAGSWVLLEYGEDGSGGLLFRYRRLAAAPRG